MARGQQRTWDGKRLQAEDRRQELALKRVKAALPTSGQLQFVGLVALVANNAEGPDKWLAADGAAISRANYPEAFKALGTTHGPGDGSTTFNLPNLAAPANHTYWIYVGR